MPWFEGTHTETRDLPVSADVAAAHFADPAAIVAATKDVERADIDGEVVHFLLKEEDHGVMKFQGDYRCRYTRDGNVVRWETLEGNTDQSGEARFEPKGDGCVLHYTETVKVDLQVPKMMAPMIKPVISALLANTITDFVKAMARSL